MDSEIPQTPPAPDEPDRPEEPGAPGDASDASGADDAGPSVRRIEIGYVDGDLTIRGADTPHVHLHADDDDEREALSQGEGDGAVLRFPRLPSDVELTVPRGSTVVVREVTGDLRAEDCAELAVERVHGDAEVTGVAVVDLGRIQGDLAASGCGALRARNVAGDVGLRDLAAAPLLGRVGGDLTIQGSAGLDARDTVGGDVVIEGCAQDVSLRGPIGGDLRAEGCGGALRFGAVGGDLRAHMGRSLVVEGPVGGDCDLAEIAGDAELRGAVGGDLRASLVSGLAVAGAIGSDADLATIGRAVSLRAVGGSLTVEALAGPLTVGTVGGDARLRTCLGPIRLELVAGDLTLQRAAAGVAAARVGGDAALDTPLAAGAAYQVRAAGDISLRVRGEVHARFVAQTLGGEIRTKLPLTMERGRRRNLVGVLGRGDATVTLNSDGGDIFIAAADGIEEDTMGDDFVGKGTTTDDAPGGARTGANPRHWEGSFGGHRFRVRWDPGAQPTDDPDGVGGPRRGFGFEWEHNPEDDRRAADDFERRMNELRDKAEQVARRAAEQAQRYAERAARRARDTDWEAVGREVRTAIERAMGDLEEAIGQMRGEFEARRGGGGFGGGSGASAGPRPGGAQRVRIEHEDEGDAFASTYGQYGAPGSAPGEAAGAGFQTPPPAAADVEGQRRAILEQLRNGEISLDEAERRLNGLR